MKQALIMAGILALLPLAAQAAGMQPSANLLPPGYVAAPIPAPASAITYSDDERSGIGEAELTAAPAPQPFPAKTSAADYVDVPALAPMDAALPQEGGSTAAAQGGAPASYRDGNFNFKSR